jgi:citrate lyase subunit beta / citryl-CoA lyase
MGERLRRSVLFTPGTRVDRWTKALQGPADVAVADLEDAVPPSQKDAARGAVAEAVRGAPAGRTERAVRINAWPSPWARADVAAIAPAAPELVVVPKAEDPAMVQALDLALRKGGCSEAPLLLLCETARGVLAAPALAAASPRVVALAFGAEDYAASVGAQRTPQALEVLWARSRVVAAAAAAGVEAIDMVCTALDDVAALEAEARLGAQLGYRGKMLIHPKQVEVVHQAYRPSAERAAWAARVVAAMEGARAEEGGVVVVDGAMVDKPLLVQARRILALRDAP